MITWVIVLEVSKLIVTVLKICFVLFCLDLQHNVSLLWNTDCVPVFKSSKFSIWPLYFIINELPSGERTKRENILFAGLWFGDTKPFMLTFLQPFHSSLRKLETEGVVIKLKLRNDTKEMTSKVILLFFFLFFFYSLGRAICQQSVLFAIQCSTMAA